jgi:hypothetical protein
MTQWTEMKLLVSVKEHILLDTRITVKFETINKCQNKNDKDRSGQSIYTGCQKR